MSSQMSLFPSKDLPEEEEHTGEIKLSAIDEMFAASRRYRSSREYMELLQFIARFPKYSAFNCFLLYLQNPSMTYVATAGRWRKQFKRRLKADARPLVILAPMSPVRFLYDLKDTEGQPVSPDLLKPYDKTGRVRRAVYDKTLHNCAIHGIAARDVDLRHQYADSIIPLTYKTLKQFESLNLDSQMKYLILLERGHALEEKYSSLAYDLGHIFCGHLGIDDKAWWQDRRGTGQTQARIEAESVAFLVCRRKGLLENSGKFLSGYAQEDREIPAFSLNAVLYSAHYVEEMGKSRWRMPKKKSRYQSE